MGQQSTIVIRARMGLKGGPYCGLQRRMKWGRGGRISGGAGICYNNTRAARTPTGGAETGLVWSMKPETTQERQQAILLEIIEYYLSRQQAISARTLSKFSRLAVPISLAAS